MDEYLVAFRARLTEAIVGATTRGVSRDNVCMALLYRLQDFADLPREYRNAAARWQEATQASNDRLLRAFDGLVGKLVDAAKPDVTRDDIAVTLSAYAIYGVNLDAVSREYLEMGGDIIRRCLEGLGETSREGYRDN